MTTILNLKRQIGALSQHGLLVGRTEKQGASVDKITESSRITISHVKSWQYVSW